MSFLPGYSGVMSAPFDLSAFPAILGYRGAIIPSSSSSQTLILPDGVIAGELIIAAVATSQSRTFTWPSPWVRMFSENNGSSTAAMSIAYNLTTAPISDVNVSLDTGAAVNYFIYQIGRFNGAPEWNVAKGHSNSPNPPNLTPSWGEKKTLWLPFAAKRNNNTEPTYPSNYTDGDFRFDNTNNNYIIATARRELEAASEDAEPFVFSGSAPWVASMVAVQGVGRFGN
jgi:hypothetical protein